MLSFATDYFAVQANNKTHLFSFLFYVQDFAQPLYTVNSKSARKTREYYQFKISDETKPWMYIVYTLLWRIFLFSRQFVYQHNPCLLVRYERLDK